MFPSLRFKQFACISSIQSSPFNLIVEKVLRGYSATVKVNGEWNHDIFGKVDKHQGLSNKEPFIHHAVNGMAPKWSPFGSSFLLSNISNSVDYCRHYSTAADDSEDSYVVRLYGLPYSATKEDIIDFFEGLPISSDDIDLLLNQRGQPSGQAYVQLMDAESVEQAMSFHKKHLGSRYVLVLESNKMEAEQARERQGNFSSDRRPSYSDSYHPRSTGHSVFMRGLPFESTEDDVLEFFAPQKPVSVILHMARGGRPRGTATASFSSHEEAVEAQKKDRNLIGQRYIELFLNSQSEEQEKMAAYHFHRTMTLRILVLIVLLVCLTFYLSIKY